MSATALVPGPLYGLRTWVVAGEPGHERLEGPQQAAPWPAGGGQLAAVCPIDPRHAAPAPGCTCGIHAWHPRRGPARRVLGTRGRIPGVVEAGGAVEVHRDGFRAERARPFAFFLAPPANAALVGRLAEAYHAEVVPARGPDAVLAWCRERGLGLDAAVVDELLGAEGLAALRRARRRTRLRVAGAATAIALMLFLGLELTADPGDRPLSGRSGPVQGSP
ncbi:MAG TPA: hypothetical protein VE526_12375 [Solirubrobacteraceae bacterium]|nr:hypothetical protein [Solirubrobacteraceae bacterium]